jgi:hypothetical protein
MTLLLWLHQTNDYDGICCFSGYIKPMTMTVFVNVSHWFDVTREATNTVSHWFDVTREATS